MRDGERDTRGVGTLGEMIGALLCRERRDDRTASPPVCLRVTAARSLARPLARSAPDIGGGDFGPRYISLPEREEEEEEEGGVGGVGNGGRGRRGRRPCFRMSFWELCAFLQEPRGASRWRGAR